MSQKLKSLIKTYYRPFLLIFVIYLVAFFTLYRDQYFFADDTARSAIGYDYSDDFNRISSNIIVHLLQLQPGFLNNIAPFGQIFGFAVLAITSIFLVYLFADKKPSIKRPVPLILSTLLALMPFMINAWQYQFETPWFAMALLMATLPYVLFWQKTPSLKLVFSNSGRPTPRLHLDENLVSFFKILIITTLCNIFVWTSWQISTGVFLTIGLALIFRDIIQRKKLPWSDIITFIIAYILATIFAYITTLGMHSYVDTSMFPLMELPAGVIRNIGYVLNVILNSFNGVWLILGILSVIGLLVINRFRTILLSIFYFIIAFPISIGPCLTLQIYHINARSLVGPVVTFTILILVLISTIHVASPIKTLRLRLRPLLLAPIFLLLYSFITYSWSYGNALTDQHRYEETRISMLAHDLAELYPTENLDKYIVVIDGSIGPSPFMVNHFSSYPISSFVFFNYMTGLSPNNLSYARLQNYYGRPQINTFSNPTDDSIYAFSCSQLHAIGLTETYKNFYYTISDTRNSSSDVFPYNPRQLIKDAENLTDEDIAAYNLTIKDFAVCVELNPEAKSFGSDKITIYDGQLVQKDFDPRMHDNERLDP